MLAQHPQMLRDGRLRDPELGADRGDQLAGRPLAVGQQLEDPPPHRVAEDVEGVHGQHSIANNLYKSRVISTATHG